MTTQFEAISGRASATAVFALGLAAIRPLLFMSPFRIRIGSAAIYWV